MSSFQPSAGPSKRTTLNPYKSIPRPPSNNQFFVWSPDDPYPTFFEEQKGERESYISQYVSRRLSQSGALDAKRLYETRVRTRQIFLENLKRTASTSRVLQRIKLQRERKKLQAKKEKKGIISNRKIKESKLWTPGKECKDYSLFVPLHNLWLGYMSELLALPMKPEHLPATPPAVTNSASMHAKLVKADFHGSILSVKESKNPCLVGLTGIVVLETENAFQVITKENKFKLIPKQNTIFALRIPFYDIRPFLSLNDEAAQDRDSRPFSMEMLPLLEFTLYGNQFQFSAAERSAKKFKPKETIEL